MKRKSLQQWMEIYSKKTGDTVVLNDPARHLFYLPERGFCQLSIDRENSRLIIWEVCTNDGKFWRDFALMEADGQGLSSVRTTTTRNIKAYLRLFGGKDYRIGMANMIVCNDQDGRMVTCGRQNNEWVIDIYLNKNNDS